MKSESSNINLSIVSEFMKLYEKGQESNEGVKKGKKVNKSTQSEIFKPKKKKKNKSKENATLQAVNSGEHPTQIHGSSKKVKSSKKKSISNMGDLEVQRMNLVMTDDVETLLDVSNVRGSDGKPKKRNKTATNTHEDTEEVARKKVKSNDICNQNKNLAEGEEKVSRKRKHRLKNVHAKKNQNSNEENLKNAMKKRKGAESALDTLAPEEPATAISSKVAKKFKPQNIGIVETAIEENTTGDQSTEKENTAKKSKKKRHKVKSLQDDNAEAKMDGEPAVKQARKQEVKPEAIAKDLQDLSIGDNAHTLSNLLDEMTVMDNNKKTKDKQKQNKNKRNKTNNLEGNTRNKDKKGGINQQLQPSVLVENLPLKIMFTYKKLLLEHFDKFGTVAAIGVAETYPTEEPKPVFTTTVYFKEEEDAIKALEEDNTLLEGNRIRVRRPLPPWETTVVVRARVPLCDQTVSSALCGAGRIRNIRHLVKEKNYKATAFVLFDGPEAVERALKMADEVRICGKKIEVNKYKYRSNNNSNIKNTVKEGGDNSSND